LRKTGLHIVSINNDVMKIYIREKMTQKIQSILMDRNQEFIPNGKLSVKIKLFGLFDFQIQIHYWLKIKLKKY
jgi:hypothetical protein